MITIRSIGNQIFLADRGRSATLPDDVAKGAEVVAAALSRVLNYVEGTGPPGTRSWAADDLIYEVCCAPWAVLFNRMDTMVALRLSRMLEAALSQQHQMPAQALVTVHEVAVQLQLRRVREVEEWADATSDAGGREARNRLRHNALSLAEESAREYVRESVPLASALPPAAQRRAERRVRSWAFRTRQRLPLQDPFARELIERWALVTRYDLLLAQQLEVRRGTPRWLLKLTWVMALVVVVCGLLALLGHPLALAVGVSSFVYYWTAAAVGTAFAILLLCWPHLGRAWGTRLGAVSILGYVALLSTQPALGLNESRSLLHQLGLPLLAIVLSGVYLLVGEVSKRVRDRRSALQRATLLLVLGLAQSWAIGAVGYVLLRPRAVDVFPIYIIWGPIALAVGLVVQTLWEQDAITEPI